MKRRGWKGRIISGIGVLLLFCALGLTFYNMWDSDRAQRSAERLAEQLDNYREEHSAEDEAVETVEEDIMPGDTLSAADKTMKIDPETPMQEVLIDGKYYIGNLLVPVLGLNLPVISEWSYESLKISPCRYMGSVYKDNMIIAAHNYQRHFGPVRYLDPGTEIQFVDMVGNTFYYEVELIEVMMPTEVERMEVNDSDLTLFTCVGLGYARYAIRCRRTAVTYVLENLFITGEATADASEAGSLPIQD